MYNLERPLLLQASPNVLKAYIALRELKPETRLKFNALRSLLVKLLSEKRKDLGLATQGLKEEELSNLMIKLESSGTASEIVNPIISKTPKAQ